MFISGKIKTFGKIIYRPFSNISNTSDPYWNNVVLLMHLDGELLDEKGHSIDYYSNQMYVTDKQFGTHSMYLAEPRYISPVQSSDWDFSDSDFTIEWWEYRLTNSDNTIVCTKDANEQMAGGMVLGWVENTESKIYLSSNGVSWDISNGNTIGQIDVQKWTHIAITRNMSTFRTFKNGQLQDQWSSNLPLHSNQKLVFGRRMVGGTPCYFNGYLDEIRITKGISRYNTNFNIPTKAFPTF